MGNSSSALVELNVDWGDQEYGVAVAGRPLKGEVIVTVKKTMEGSPVMIRLSGKEKVSMNHKKSEKGTPLSVRPLIMVDLPLQSFHKNNKIERGTYTFPFSIPISEALPSSDQYPIGNKSKPSYQIQYRMVASVGSLEKNLPFQLVSAPLPREPAPFMVKPTFHRINSMGVFNSGRLVLGASTSDANVGRGEDIELFLACRNDSSVEIRSVDIKVVEYLHWSMAGDRKKEQREATRTLVLMKNVALPNVNVAKKQRSEVKRRKYSHSYQDQTYKELFNELASCRYPIRIPIPETARDSYAGELIDVYHQVEIKVITSSLSTNIITEVPFRVGTPRLRQNRPGITTFFNIAEVTPHINSHVAPPPIPRPAVTQRSRTPTPSPVGQAELVTVEAAPKAPPHVIPILYEENPPPMAPRTNNSSSGNIPFVPAIPANESFRASLVTAPDELIILGGPALQTLRQSSSGLSPLGGASAPPAISDVDVTIGALLEQMKTSVNAFELISQHLMDSRWIRLLGVINPKDYGSVIGHVKNSIDQPRVASLLSPYVNKGEQFLCAFAAQAVRNTSEKYRSVTAQRLIPLCADIAHNCGLIQEVLNDWELTVTARDFEDAMLAATETSAVATY